MSKNLLDPRDYKHVKSDENSTTLQHKRGHIVTIAHNAVSPKNREMLKSLADRPSDNSPQYGQVVKKFDGGGQVPAPAQQGSSQPTPPKPISKNELDNAGGLSGAWSNAKKEFGFAAGGMTSTDGSKVPAPNGSGTDTNKEKVAHDLGKPSRGEPSDTDEQSTILNPSKMWENLKNGMAKGGAVKMASGGHVENNAPGATSSGAYDAGLPCLNPHCKSHGKPHPNCRCYANMANGGEIKLRYCAHGKPHMESCEYSKGISEQGKDIRHGNHNTDQKEMSQDFAREEAKGRASEERQIKPKMKGLAEGGRVMYAEGTDSPIDEEASVYKHEREKNAADHYSEAARLLEKAGDSVTPPANPNFNSVTGQMQPQSQPAMPDTENDENANAPAIEDPIDHGNDHYGHPEAQSASQPQQAMPDQSQAPQAAGQADQPQPQQANVIPQTQVAPPPPGAQEHLAENAAFVQDLNNGHITPKTYNDLMFHNKDGSEKSTLGKIGSIFGLMLSGMGSGLAHQPNMALHMMDNVIKNDLDAQQKSKDNAQNYLKINQQRLLNDANVQNVLASSDYTDAQKASIIQGIQMKAYTQSYMQMGSVALHDQLEKLKKLQPGSPQYQQAAQTALLMADAVEKNNAQAAVLGAAGVDSLGNYGLENQGQPNAQGQPQGQVDPEQQFKNRMQILELTGQKDKADSLRSRHIAGVPGFANAAVPEDFVRKMTAMNVLDNKGKDVLGYIKQHTGTWNPQTRRVATQKVEEMKNFYNDSINGGALTQGRLKWYDEQFSKAPTDILNQLMGSTKQLEEMVNSNATRRNIELKGRGFPVEVAKPGESQYKTVNGVKYMRGPNGEAIKVK